MDDADIDTAINSILMANLFNAGQSCCAGTRTFVHEKIYDEVV